MSPQNRQQLVDRLARLVGWPATARHVEDFLRQIEDQGVTVLPTAQWLELQKLLPLPNPYARKD